jgi:hypothetical protein
VKCDTLLVKSFFDVVDKVEQEIKEENREIDVWT